MTDVDIAALAKLARLEVSEEERLRLSKEIPEILSFVEAIQKADISGVSAGHGLHNVMREDTNPHESGIYTDRLIDAAPEKKNNKIVVKQVISRKKS